MKRITVSLLSLAVLLVLDLGASFASAKGDCCPKSQCCHGGACCRSHNRNK
jgi:hypothetical protein